MYISVHRKLGIFLHKHASLQVVCDLDYIEAPLGPVDVYPVGSNVTYFSHWTDAELGALWKHTTEQDTVPYLGTMLRMVLTELAAKVPTSTVDPAEADMQARWVELEDRLRQDWLYAPKSIEPRVREEDHKLPGLRGKLTPEEAKQAVVKRTAYAAARTNLPPPPPLPPDWRGAGTAAAAPTAPVPGVVRAPQGPPKRGVCAEIWQVLDAEFAAQGASPNRDRVKALALEHGWNSSTASVQFAAWRKQRNLP